MTKKAILISTIILATISSATAEVKKELFPFTKELKREESPDTSSRFGSFDIDEEIYSVLNKDQSNLRIIDSSGAEVPFLLRTRKGEREISTQRPIPLKKVSFNKLPDNRIEIELSKEDDKHYDNVKLSCVKISSNIRDFEKHVSIWSSDNRSDWEQIASDKPIFDYSKFIDIRNSLVSFQPSPARYFKIRISNISEKQQSPFTRFSRTMQKGEETSSVESTSFTRTDFKINDISFYEKTTEVVKDKILKQPYSSSQFSVIEIDKDSLITFATRKTPITKISLQTDLPFFYRSFKVEAGEDQKNWRIIHSGIISRISDDPESLQAQSIHLPRANRNKFYRITITNNDSPPLEINSVALEGETREIVFYSDKAKSYRLLYGAEESGKPVYDIAQVLSHTISETTARYKSDSQIPNPDFNKTAKHKTFISRRTVITIAVILMIVVLGWVIAQTVKKIE